MALQRKVDKVLTGSFSGYSSDFVESLLGLSAIYDSNTLSNRRNLRNLLTKRTLQLNQDLITNFEGVAKKLDSISDHAENLLKGCDELSEKLKASKSSSSLLIAQMQQLQEKKKTIDKKQDVVQKILFQFQLSKSEQDVLHAESKNGNFDLDETFFFVFEKIHSIKYSCGKLKTNHQLSLDIVDMMEKYSEAAYEKLYLWVQSKIPSCCNVHYDLFPRVLAMLVNRPVYMEHCLSEITSLCKSNLNLGFSSALGAIDMRAHDPFRYVSDIFAWIHQGMINQKELIHSFLSEEDADSQLEMMVGNLMLHKIFESLQRPLKIRVEQALESHRSPILCYQLFLILDFYIEKLSSIFPYISSEINESLNPYGFAIASWSNASKDLTKVPNSTLTCIISLRDRAEQIFYECVSDVFSPLVSSPPIPPFDLSPPPILIDLLHRLVLILNEYKTRLSSGGQIGSIVSSWLDPMLTVVESSASKLDTSESCVYHVNCLFFIITSLDYDFAQSRLEVTRLQLEDKMHALIKHQTSLILSRCSLDDKLTQWKLHKHRSEEFKNTKLVDWKGMSVVSLQPCMKAFYVAILGLGTNYPPTCEKLIDSQMKQKARIGIAKLLATVHTSLFEAISDPLNGYPDPSALPLHTPHQIELLLDCQL